MMPQVTNSGEQRLDRVCFVAQTVAGGLRAFTKMASTVDHHENYVMISRSGQNVGLARDPPET